ncbi:phage tail spike protein [Halolactibacillus sp. JCM 19043]|uniref:phage tail spike protein n=1 Tax=Halolactibacillus sp. JCM 19043 TaxID=1460638 RepID=UPI00078334F1|nr:phage tail spike protein [Halolactibacillus sp. JCM 19043]
MIHVINGQNDELMDIISDREVLFNSHKQSLENQLEQFDFECLPNLSYADKLTDRNRLIIPSEDEGYIEFIIQNVIKTNDRIEVYTTASYLDLIKAKVIYPITLTDYNATAALSFVTNETEWRPGTVESDALRTITIDTHTNPFTMLKRVANEFDLELRFRTETDGNRVTNRYVDLLDRVGTWDGREVTFGKDLDSIERSEDTSDIYTALLCLGPEGIEGNRLGALIEDEDALRRWGRPDPITGELKHLIGIYEPQSEHLDMTLSDLEQYGRTELNKRINAVITYSANIVDLEHVPGMENKKIRFGDTIRIKDEKFSPPLYVEARVFEQSRDIFENSLKEVKLGDFVEFTEEQVLAIWKQLQAEIKEKISATEMLEYTYDKHTIDDKDDIVFTEGKTFAEAVGIDAKSHADTVSSTAETNAKNYAEDKSAEVLQQALAYAVSQTAYDSKMSEIASDLADKSSVEYVDGQLVDKVNVGDVYTISEIDNALLNKVSVTQYQTDMDGIVQDISVNSTLIGQNQEAIALKANQTDVDALSGKVTDNSAQLTVQAGQISSKVDATYVQGLLLILRLVEGT